jgi:hypothetical protein
MVGNGDTAKTATAIEINDLWDRHFTVAERGMYVQIG